LIGVTISSGVNSEWDFSIRNRISKKANGY
jgi:hypothetical protein